MMMIVGVYGIWLMNSTQKSYNMHHSISRRERRKYTYYFSIFMVLASSQRCGSGVMQCRILSFIMYILKYILCTKLLEYFILSPLSISFFPSQAHTHKWNTQYWWWLQCTATQYLNTIFTAAFLLFSKIELLFKMQLTIENQSHGFDLVEIFFFEFQRNL